MEVSHTSPSLPANDPSGFWQESSLVLDVVVVDVVVVELVAGLDVVVAGFAVVSGLDVV